jgi:hypothetical protein
MNPNWEDDRIRELLAESGKRDAAHAPDFARVWGAAVARAKSERRRYFLRVTAIAASVAVLGVLVSRVFQRERIQETGPDPSARSILANAQPSTDLPWQSAVLICEWRSPTDFLLRLPGEDFREPDNFPIKTKQ